MRISLENQLEDLRERGGRETFSYWQFPGRSSPAPSHAASCKNFIILFSAIYLRRYKTEKQMRHKLEVELQFESKKKSQLEEAVQSLHFQYNNSKLEDHQEWT